MLDTKFARMGTLEMRFYFGAFMEEVQEGLVRQSYRPACAKRAYRATTRRRMPPMPTLKSSGGENIEESFSTT